ncbi:hypothetical protein [Nocardia salmonicida]|nr:hypothetical protein [Nocardia salmonicida]
MHFAVDVKATEPIHLSAHAGYLWATLDRDLLVTPSIREILGAYKNLVCT